MKLRWITFLVSGFTAIWIAAIGNVLAGYYGAFTLVPWPLIILSIFILASGTMFTGLYSRNLFLPSLPKSDRGEKYKKNPLDADNKRAVLQSISNHMEHNKPYLDPEFSLKHLAECTQLKSYTISQVLNTCLGKNFYDYVNEYRVKESQRLLVLKNKNGAPKKTVLEILYKVGFNSKSAFHRAFKKYTGMTPTKYTKSHESAIHLKD